MRKSKTVLAGIVAAAALAAGLVPPCSVWAYELQTGGGSAISALESAHRQAGMMFDLTAGGAGQSGVVAGRPSDAAVISRFGASRRSSAGRPPQPERAGAPGFSLKSLITKRENQGLWASLGKALLSPVVAPLVLVGEGLKASVGIPVFGLILALLIAVPYGACLAVAGLFAGGVPEASLDIFD